MTFWIYIMASGRNGTLYTGQTDNPLHRAWEHRTGARPGFASRYKVKMLVWYEPHDSRESARWRETAIKGWNRIWKLVLVETFNPGWRDLYETLGV